MGAEAQQLRGRAAMIVVALAGMGRLAVAQGVIVEADGALNVGFTQITQGTAQPDPNPQAADVKPTSVSAVFTEIRPGITVQTGSPRLTWRAGYVFSGNLSLTGEQLQTYSNQANLALVGEFTKYTLVTLTAAFAQGGTSFLLGQRPADAGQPEIRAPGNPNQLSATGAESLSWELGRQLSLQQALVASVAAPQDALDQRNSAVSATVALERLFTRDTLGAELHGSVSWLRPQQVNLAPFKSFANSVLGRWNHDFSPGWNGLITAGVEQVFTDTGSRPLAFLPTGSASARYTSGDMFTGIDFNHGTATNLQVGSVSLADRITLHGGIVLDARKRRTLSFSTGFLHNQPIGEVGVLVAAGTGNAVEGDAGFTTAIAKDVVASVRYSVAYQYGQAGGLAPTLAHIALIGVTATLKNTERPVKPLPIPGRRVDGADSIGFPVVDDDDPPSSQ